MLKRRDVELLPSGVPKSVNCSQLLGKRDLVGADGFTGSRTANPANIAMLTIFAGRMSGENQGACKVVAYVTIEFDAVFTEPRTLPES